MKVAIVGGGTGGHIYPALAIAEELQKRELNTKILFIGSQEGLERELLPKERFAFVTVRSRGMLRKLSYKAFSAPFVSIIGFFQAYRILKAFSPKILISTGGYVSFPVAFAARLLRIPVLIHELNAIPGLSNKICSFFAKKVTVSFPETRKFFPRKKAFFTGTPVRNKITSAIKEVSRSRLGLYLKRKTILILGGSQGAQKLNIIVPEILEDLCRENCQVIHITGKKDYDHIVSLTKNLNLVHVDSSVVRQGRRKKEVKKTYKLYNPILYMYNIWDGLASADLIISRAGGSTLGEILARGLPSILIPFPYSAGRHQERNAKILEKAGAAILLKNEELSPDYLLSIIRKLLSEKGEMESIAEAARNLSSPEASKIIVDIIYEILNLPKVIKQKPGRAGRKKKRVSKQ